MVHMDVCKMRLAPPTADPWEDWAEGLQEVDEAEAVRAARL
jgi:hypothetical protein